MPAPNALIIVNPAARAGRRPPGWMEDAVRLLQARGFTTTIQLTQQAGHARQLAETHPAAVVVAVGGDGTVHEIACGLLQGSTPPPPLAILPAGTGNDVARLLQISNLDRALAALREPRVTTWDAIEIHCQRADGTGETRHHALLFAGAGFVGEVIRRSTARVKATFGPTLSYAVGFFAALAHHRAVNIRVRSAGFHYDGPLLTALAANASHAGGGGMHLGPGARMNDGFFDVSVIRSVRRVDVALQFLRLVRGTHVQHPAVSYFPSTWLEIDADRPLEIVADGEIIGVTPARLTLRPAALSLWAGR